MIEIYTDGSTARNGDPTSPGTYAIVVVEDGQKVYEYSFYEENGTTNNRMEMMALKQALVYIQQNTTAGDAIMIYSDSELVINCYIGSWRRKSNLDLWQQIDNVDSFISSEVQVNLQWVKGHSDNEWNNYVDKLCTSAYPSGPEKGDKKKDWLIKDNKALLKECLVALNSVPNTKISSAFFKDTYTLASEVQKHLK